MDGFTLTYRLSLALILDDTTTKKPVNGREIIYMRDGKPLKYMEKDMGTVIFQNLGEEDFDLELVSQKYEKDIIPIRYNDYKNRQPIIRHSLVPNKNNANPAYCLEMSGNMSGISELCCVRLGNNNCLIREFDERKKILSLFNPHKLSHEDDEYALINPDEGSFEKFKVVKEIDPTHLKIDHKLERPFRINNPVCDLIYGRTFENGDYLIRIRDLGGSSKWLISYKVNQEQKFLVTDFSKPSLDEDLLEKAKDKEGIEIANASG